MRNKAHKIPKTQAIKAIGLELEGAWTKYYKDDKPTRQFEQGVKTIRKGKPKFLKYDGSVRINKNESGCEYIGEIASKPMQPRAITSWVRRNQPDAFNKTCGAHMHISTKSQGDYICLTDNAFWKTFKKQLAKWGKTKQFKKNHQFWKRYEGDNTYCKPDFIPAKQLHANTNRYTQINFCWSKHGTLEFRILPIFETADLQIEAFFTLIKIVESYLENNKSYKKVWSVKENIKDYPKGFTTTYEDSFDPTIPQKSKTIIPSKSRKNQLIWNQNETISLSKPLSPNTQKTYYIVTPDNIHLAPETTEHISQQRAQMEPELFEEEEEGHVEPGTIQTREVTESDIVLPNQQRPQTMEELYPEIFNNSTGVPRLMRRRATGVVNSSGAVVGRPAEPITQMLPAQERAHRRMLETEYDVRREEARIRAHMERATIQANPPIITDADSTQWSMPPEYSTGVMNYTTTNTEEEPEEGEI